VDVLKKSSRAVAIARYCARHLGEVRAPDMAAALSFRTLFGLIPVLFVTTLLIRSLMGDNFQSFVQSSAGMIGLNEISVNIDTDGPNGAQPQQLSAWIEELVRVSGTVDLSTLGLIGLAVVLFSAIWLIVAIENAFNIVCRAPNARPWHRRILVYWTMLTLGPLLLAMVPLLDAELRSVIDGQPSLPKTYAYVRPILGFSLLFILLFVAYAIIPTVRMRWKTLLIGAFVGAVGLELGRNFLGIYMERAFSGNRLYGSLGLVPIFMFWVYAMWLIVLFGLQASSLLHALMSDERIRSVLTHQLSAFEPAIAVGAMQWICDNHRRGSPITLTALSEHLKLNHSTATRLVALLAESNLIVFIAENGRIVLARPALTITIAEVLRIGFRVPDINRSDGNGDLMDALRTAQLKSVVNLTFEEDRACKDEPSKAELTGNPL